MIRISVGVVVAAVVVWACAWFARRRERLDGPYLAQQIRDWHAADPVIAPLTLPTVKPLKARMDRPPAARVVSFGRHL